ncbi:hypothetical protein AWB81_04226 [Caballeronia arationis]|nr:hypothetical protein AWB81_04226 [Caballeronia arationis]
MKSILIFATGIVVGIIVCDKIHECTAEANKNAA